MNIQTAIQSVQSAIPPSVQGGTTGVSLFTMIAAFLDQIHGPAATVGVILGAVWVALQIYIAIDKHWFHKKGK